jgi:hypothetical protein
MESIQIRLPKEILEKIDQLVQAGIFQTRSDILREIIRNFFLNSNYNGSLPYIVGPFTKSELEKIKNTSLEMLKPDQKALLEIKSRLKTVDLHSLVNKI